MDANRYAHQLYSYIILFWIDHVLFDAFAHDGVEPAQLIGWKIDN